MAGTVRFKVKVQAGTRKTRLVGLYGDALRISLSEPAVKNRANKELIRFLSELFGIPKEDVSIDKGLSSQMKLISINGIELKDAKDHILKALEEKGGYR